MVENKAHLQIKSANRGKVKSETIIEAKMSQTFERTKKVLQNLHTDSLKRT